MPIDPSIITAGMRQPEQVDPMGVLGKVLTLRNAQQENQLGGIKLQQAQQGQADQQSLDQAYANGGLDRNAILGALPGHLRPTVMKQFAEADEKAATVQKTQMEVSKATNDYFGHLAAGIRDHGYDPTAAQIAIAHAKETYANNPQMLQQIGQVEQQLSDPAQIKPLADHLISISDEQQKADAAALTAKSRATAAAKPTEATLAVDAVNATSPSAPASSAALKLLKPEKAGGSAEQDDQRYRQIVADRSMGKPVTLADNAWAKGYEKQKTLGPVASSDAATARQDATHDFEVQQAGRKELSDKVETPYLTAKTSAATMRDVVSAAKDGNKVAGALQSLETTMAAIRAQGLNRINTAEIGVTGDAGSMWDRIAGWAGKATSGQPVPADIQKDMLSFADILEKAAYKKYSEGFDATTKRYKLGEEKKLAEPAGGGISVTSPSGKSYSFQDQASANKFVADAKARGLWK